MNYKETIFTCIKDSQFKCAQWRTGKVKTASITYTGYILLTKRHSKNKVTHII